MKTHVWILVDEGIGKMIEHSGFEECDLEVRVEMNPQGRVFVHFSLPKGSKMRIPDGTEITIDKTTPGFAILEFDAEIEDGEPKPTPDEPIGDLL